MESSGAGNSGTSSASLDRVAELIEESAIRAAEINAKLDLKTRPSKVARTSSAQISQ